VNHASVRWIGGRGVLGFAGLAQASPLDLKQVSAEAKWAAHLDVDALMASKSMQKVREQIRKDNPRPKRAWP